MSKNNSALIDNAENLDIVMSIFNLLEYSQNSSMTLGSLWNCYRDKINDIDAMMMLQMVDHLGIKQKQ